MPSRFFFHRIVVALLALPAAALGAPPDAGTLFNAQQPAPRALPDTLPQHDDRPRAQTVPKEVRGVTVRLTEVRFTGDVGVVSDERLQAQVAPAIGHELDFAGLQALADRVSDYLKAQGYFLAHAYLPKQYLSGGVVEIAILAGRLQLGDGGVIVQGRLRIPAQRLQWIIQSSAKPGEVARERDFERAVLLINDLPGIDAQSNVERGAEPGTARLVVDADEAPLLAGEIGLDNFGNRYTGTWRATGRLDVNDPLRIGDRLSLSAVGASDMQIGQLDYDWPVNYRGLRADVAFSAMQYTIGEDLADLQAAGSSTLAEGGLRYPVFRSRAFNLWTAFNFASKQFQDEVFGERVRDKHVNAWSFTLSGDGYDALGGGALSRFSATFTSGDLNLGGVPTDLALDRSSGANTNGAYSKLNVNAARLQRLGQRLTFYGAVDAQFASKNLDSSEKFFLGGPTAVRAYSVGEGAGDEGWVANLELRYDFTAPRLPGALQAIAFFDTGQIMLHKNPWSGSLDTLTGDNQYVLSGAGVGLNLTQGRRYAIRTAWAAAIGDNRGRSSQNLNSDGKRATSQYWLYGVWRL